MGLQEANIHQLLKVRSEIDEEIRRHKRELTILFTDVVGSTTYFDRFGDTAGLLLIQRHDDVVAGAVQEFEGVVIKTIGDSVMAEFPDPLLAVHAAVEIQRRVFRHNQSLLESQRLHLRAGINSGVGFRRGTDFLGDAVNVAARITKRSGPSQILISKSVHQAIGSEICCRPLGSASLPGKADAEELFEVIWTDVDIYDGIRAAINAIWVSANMSRRGTQHDDFMLKTPFPDGDTEALPHTPARYEILSRIGVGGMGVVFKARDRETGEIIALKVLKPEIADQPSLMENLKNELRLARRITHKNVCRIYDFTRTDGVASISMEFVQGESLRQVLDRFGAFTARRATRLAEQICDGLSEAHAQGIVHRDIKPENFMIDEAGNVKLMDFGVAHLVREGSNQAVGTPSYMAPEQAQALPYDQRADIYALGLVLFEMFTGSVAFAGDTPIAVALKQMVEAPRNPRDVEHTIPVHIERVILRCLEKDPDKRFASVQELKAALAGDSASGQKIGRAGRNFSRIQLVDPIRALGRKRRGLLTALGLIVLLAVLFTAAIAFDRTTKNKQELAAFQNAQAVDTEGAWNAFLRSHGDGQLSLAAQERLNKLRIQAEVKSRAASYATLPATPFTLAPAAEIAPAPAVLPDVSGAAAAKQRPNWTTLFDTVPIRGGTFMMGKDDGKKDEKPRHRVRLDGFQMSRTEITNRQYATFLKETGHPPPKDPSFAKNYLIDYPDLPVVNVSYQDALDFCKWASAKFGVTVRLPTEAEWEYAALGGKKDALYPWGFDSPNSRARYRQNLSGRVQTVGRTSFPPNGFGLYNMSGNVNEWVSDFYSKDYYSVSTSSNPRGPDRGTKRGIRGGSWADDETRLWLARRASRDPQERSDQLGFRIVVKSSIPSSRTQQASLSAAH